MDVKWTNATALVQLTAVAAGDALEAGGDATDERLVHGVARLGQAVVRELPVAGRRDEPAAPQVGQVARDGGLGDAEYFDDVADAQLAGGRGRSVVHTQHILR